MSALAIVSTCPHTSHAQVCNPLDLAAKLAAGSGPPPLSGLKRLVKCLNAIVQIADLLEQAQLADALREMLAFVHTWFDLEERSVLGVVNAGNDDLDALKDQFAALPTLLQQVRLSLGSTLAPLHSENVA